MSLGVLNNLNSIYAENSLNNTSNSLSKVLNQLSSGSKINSGADDAAGLSLVDGLQANQMALTQSETNATEGVGLLTVADGALSQVTNLLNRAVTLATEASNGILNSSQDTAANQEYQSILSEVNNIGSTTTYNQEQVFGSNTAIYTGDSTASGASIDQLNIRSLSSSNLGDTAGVISYGNASSTTSDTFIDTGADNAVVGASAATTAWTAAAAAATTLTFASLTSSGAVTTDTVNIAKGATLGDVATDINNAGLGLTATVTTAEAAGATGTADQGDLGLQITGSFGTATTEPLAAQATGAASYTGTLTGGNTSLVGDTLTGSITLQTGTNAGVTIKMSDVAAASAGGVASYTTLAAYINANTQLGVTATAPGATGTLILSSTSGAQTAMNVADNLTDTVANVATSYTAKMATNVVLDTGSAGMGAYTVAAGAAANSNSIATINYADAGGQNLSATDLTTQADAETALTDLNTAIKDVAAQDGYLGAQINTLNSVSSVLSTQSENVTAAQNAVQATDYASATSNMSKYQILSQTGISALAQANSMQQEVTKLLQ